MTKTAFQPADHYQQLIHEISNRQNDKALNAYYTKLYKNKALRPFYQHNWQTRVTPMFNILQNLPKKEQPWRVLDAGCGVGTETILWAKSQPHAHIWGIDASEERLQTAQNRLKTYANVADQITFANADIFDTLQEKSFDLVWTMEALSHIDPAEKFIEAVYNNVPQGGYLVISDSHLLNPQMAWRIYKMRRRGTAERTQKVMAGGKLMSYAQERLFGIGTLSNMVEAVGFKVTKTQLRIFFPPGVAKMPALFPLAVKMDNILDKIPLIRNLGGIFTLVAQKA